MSTVPKIDGQTLTERRSGRLNSAVAQKLYRDERKPLTRALIEWDKIVGKRHGSVPLLQKLKPLHRQIVAMHLQGMANVEIGEVIDMSAGWVGRVLQDPLVQELVKGFMQGVDAELEGLYPLAVDALRKGLQSEETGTRLKTVDRFVKMSQRFRGDNAAGTSAEDVIKKALELAGNAVRVVEVGMANRDNVLGGRAQPSVTIIEGTIQDGSERTSDSPSDVRTGNDRSSEVDPHRPLLTWDSSLDNHDPDGRTHPARDGDDAVLAPAERDGGGDSSNG